MSKRDARPPTRTELALAFLAIAVLSTLFLAPALFTARVLLPADLLLSYTPWATGQQVVPQNANLSDSLQEFYPSLCFFRNQVRSGHFPLWNPYVLCGTPFLADVVSAVLFPMTWLALILPVETFFEWDALIKLTLAGFGVYFFSRQFLQVRPLAAWCASVAYCFCGYSIYFLIFPDTRITMMLPWVLVAVEEGFVNAKIRWRWIFSLLVALLLMAGHIESAVGALIFFLLYLAIRVFESGPRQMQGSPINVRRSLIPALFHTFWGVLLSSAVLLPFYSYLQESATLQSRTQLVNPFRISLLRLPAMLTPYFFGSPIFNPSHATVRQMEQCIFLGAIPLLLMFYGMSRSLNTRVPALVAGMLFGFLITFGVWPFFHLFTSLPLLRQGNHIHSIQIFQFCAVLLFALGLERWSQAPPRLKILPAVFVVVQLALLLWQWFLMDRFPFLGWQTRIPWYGVLALLFLFIFCATQLRPQFAPLLLSFLLPGLGFLYGFYFNPATPGEILRSPDVMGAIRAEARVAGVGDGTLLPNMSAAMSVRDLRGYEPVVLARTQSFFDRLTGSRNDPQHSIHKVDQSTADVLKECGVEYIVSPTPLLIRGWIETRASGAFFYQASGTVSRIDFYADARKATADESLAALLSAKTRTVIFLESDQSPATAHGPGIARIAEEAPDHRQYQVRASVPGYLLIREAYGSGWGARVNGKREKLLPANYIFMAVAVPAGDSVVELNYRPWSWISGLTLTLLSLPVVVGGIIFQGWKKPPRSRLG